MKNAILNVTGNGEQSLFSALSLAIGNQTCSAWKVTDAGLTLHTQAQDATPFPAPLGTNELFPIVRSWLVQQLDQSSTHNLSWNVSNEGTEEILCVISPA